MGMTPADVRGLSLWQFKAAVAGWNKANCGEGAIDEAEAQEIAARLEEPPVWAG